MPNALSHLFMADSVVDHLSEKEKQIVKQNKASFQMGAVGPDFLYTFRELGMKDGAYANRMHSLKVYETFKAIVENVAVSKNDVQVSYLYGLVTHYVFDFIIHPYVYYITESVMGKTFPKDRLECAHNLVESAFDTYFLKNCYRKKLKIKNFFLPATKKIKLIIGQLYSQAVNKVHGFDVRPKGIAFAFTVSKIFMKGINNNFKGKKEFCEWVETRLKMKRSFSSLMPPAYNYDKFNYLNTDKILFPKIRNLNEQSNLNFEELCELAIKTSTEYIADFSNAIFNGIPLKQDKFMINYEGEFCHLTSK